MNKASLNRLAAGIGGLALSLSAGAGIASATPDLGPAVDTTCTYPQLVSALNAQSPEVGGFFNQSPVLQLGLRDFIAAGPEKRRQTASELANAPWAQPYLGSLEAAFRTCQNF